MSILLTYTEVERVEVISIPSKVASVTRSIPSKGGGILRCLEAGCIQFEVADSHVVFYGGCRNDVL